MAYVLRQKCVAELRASVDVVESGCWEWRRARAEFGYGVWSKRSLLPVSTRQTVLAHRVVGWLWLGLPAERINGNPRGAPTLQVLHRCDNPCCCNPEHLYVGNAGDNARDMVERGRLSLARLRDEQVVRIRQLALGGVSYGEIGRRLGVGMVAARDAAVGKSYARVEYPTAPARPRGRRKRMGEVAVGDDTPYQPSEGRGRRRPSLKQLPALFVDPFA